MVKVEMNTKEFDAAIKKLSLNLSNMVPVWVSIKDDWYKNNRTIFTLISPGKYPDYRGKRDMTGDTPYMRWKRKHALQKSPYPMLKAANGRIEAGTTDENSEYTYKELHKSYMVLGVQNIPYAIRHQTGSKGMPKRPFIFNARHGGEAYVVQMKRWLRLLQAVLKRRVEAAGRGGAL